MHEHSDAELAEGVVLIDPARIVPPHAVRDPAKLERIVRSMREAGWAGRPVLVMRLGYTDVALTGSHRLAAAVAAGLDEVPCVCGDLALFAAEYPDADLGTGRLLPWSDDDGKEAVFRGLGDDVAEGAMIAESSANQDYDPSLDDDVMGPVVDMRREG